MAVSRSEPNCANAASSRNCAKSSLTLPATCLIALIWAAENESGDPAVVNALLEKGADVNAKAKDSATALAWAKNRGETPIVKSLRQAGAIE